MPSLISTVLPGKLAVRARTPHSRLNSVVLPVLGLPSRAIRRGGGQTRADADEDWGSYGTERNRSALNDHAGHDRGERGEAESDEKRNGDGRGRAEPGGAFDECTEEPRNDDDLHTAIGSDVDETLADGPERAALFEGIQQENGAENDVEKRSCHDQSVDARRRDLNEGNAPNEQRERDRHDVRERHRTSRGPSQNHEKQCDREDRQQRKEREGVDAHDVAR